MKSPDNFEMKKNIRWIRLILDENHTMHQKTDECCNLEHPYNILCRHFGYSPKMKKTNLNSTWTNISSFNVMRGMKNWIN